MYRIMCSLWLYFVFTNWNWREIKSSISKETKGKRNSFVVAHVFENAKWWFFSSFTHFSIVSFRLHSVILFYWCYVCFCVNIMQIEYLRPLWAQTVCLSGKEEYITMQRTFRRLSIKEGFVNGNWFFWSLLVCRPVVFSSLSNLSVSVYSIHMFFLSFGPYGLLSAVAYTHRQSLTDHNVAHSTKRQHKLCGLLLCSTKNME